MRQNAQVSSDHFYVDELNRAPQGIPALLEEMSSQGISSETLLRDAELWCGDVDKSIAGLSVEQRLALFRAISRLAQLPDTALRAGSRQRIGNFGVYGFAMATSRTMGQAVQFGLEHIDLTGSVVRIEFEMKNGVGIFRSINPRALGDVLPFAAEFWRSSISTLMSHVLGKPFPSIAMYFPYPAPSYWQSYQTVFECPVYFESDTMEWHFHASVLNSPCAHIDQIVSGICHDLSGRLLSGHKNQTSLQRQIKNLCLGQPALNIKAGDVADSLGMSLRTLQRRLAEEGVSFQSLIDDTRTSIALEYLQNTNIPIAEIGYRCGFSDVSNFRKAFKKWTGYPAASVRS